MPVSDVLKSFRKEGYGESPKEQGPQGAEGPRSFKLTDDEVKELQGYQKGPGMEQECVVTGRLGENGEFTVTSVHSPGGGMNDENDMASQVMDKMGQAPTVRPQTIPSPG
jgi:hypothetical protein